jgi:adenylate kinase
MYVAISGTPGTGKTSVSEHLRNKGYSVVSLNDLAISNNFISGIDKKRDSKILDVDKINNYLIKNKSSSGLYIIEGHASHCLKRIEKVILLRCHPKELTRRLEKKGWNTQKVKENVEAEALDIILCEAVENVGEDNVFELETTHMMEKDVSEEIDYIITHKFKQITKYKVGKIDWSEEII